MVLVDDLVLIASFAPGLQHLIDHTLGFLNSGWIQISQVFDNFLVRLTAAPMKPQQRMWAMRVKVILRIRCKFFLRQVSLEYLTKIDKIITLMSIQRSGMEGLAYPHKDGKRLKNAISSCGP